MAVQSMRRFLVWQKRALKVAWATHQRAKARAAILQTPPAPVDPLASLEIHALTCARDYPDLLWCLKSLIFYSGRSFHVVVHDDGSLDAQSLAQLQWHLPGATIVTRDQADERMRPVLAGRDACRAFRDHCPLARRLFDFPIFASHEHFLTLDSDVLFFASPDEMLRLMDRGRPFFMADYQDSYVFPRADVRERYGVDLVPAFNTGIAFLAQSMVDHALIETYCRDLNNAGLLSHPWSEQTLFAILFSRHEVGAERLPETYGISRRRIGPETVCHHFVNDGSREFLHITGIPRLRRARFITAYTRRFG